MVVVFWLPLKHVRVSPPIVRFSAVEALNPDPVATTRLPTIPWVGETDTVGESIVKSAVAVRGSVTLVALTS